MQELTKLILEDMKPALGVTEPAAIAFAAAKAKSYTKGEVVHAKVAMNSGMYKNAFTCGIPNSHETGGLFAAALGVIAGDSELGLEALAKVTKEDNKAAAKLIEEKKVSVQLSGISSRIFIEATIQTQTDCCTVTIYDKHTNICKIVLNNEVLFEKEIQEETKENITEKPRIHQYTLNQIYEYVKEVELSELDFIKEAYRVNLELFDVGLHSDRTTFVKTLYKMNGEKIISEDEQATAQLLCNGTIEARVIGLDKPAMSITGSGAHGIICVMPLYGVYKVAHLSEESLLRATALSYLITMYIKEYSGRLSAFCGCAIAAGTGMACGLVYLKQGTLEQMKRTINNMASSITGMICDGGNQGCAMKGVTAVDTAFKSVQFAMDETWVYDIHGVNGRTPELTMKHMGEIASPGMTKTEETIVNIFERKQTE